MLATIWLHLFLISVWFRLSNSSLIQASLYKFELMNKTLWQPWKLPNDMVADFRRSVRNRIHVLKCVSGVSKPTVFLFRPSGGCSL